MLIEKALKIKKTTKSNFAANTTQKVVTFRPVADYASFNDALEEVIVANEDGTEQAGGLVQKALIAVEGKFDDSNGHPHVFDVNRLNTIADHTNAALDNGTAIPVCLDHKKDVHNTVGGLGEDARAYVKTIEESDLPNKKAIHLIGKTGLFLDNVIIKAEDAINKVKNKIVTAVSMGLNLDPASHRVMELSLVPIPAINNMGLFKFADGVASNDDTAFTWEDLETSKQTLDQLRDEYSELSEKLWTLLNNIYTSESSDIGDLTTLKQYVYTALNGYSVRVVDMLGLTDIPDGTTPMDSAATLSADAQQQMNATRMQDVSSPAAAYSAPKKGLIKFSTIKKVLAV